MDEHYWNVEFVRINDNSTIIRSFGPCSMLEGMKWVDGLRSSNPGFAKAREWGSTTPANSHECKKPSK